MTRRRIILAIVVILGLAVLVTLFSMGKETKEPRLGVGLIPDRIAKSEFWVKVYVTNQSSQVVTFPSGGPYFLILPGAELESRDRSEEHTSELQSHHDLVCRLLLE